MQSWKKDLAGGSTHWIDVIDPTRAELEQIARNYGLHETSVQDCLDPRHLPKHERIGETNFVILRSYDEESDTKADTVQELTRKVALFAGKGFILTVHRKDQPFLARLREEAATPSAAWSAQDVLRSIVTGAIQSYEAPLDREADALDRLEERVFARRRLPEAVGETFYLKRRASVFRRMLRLSQDVISSFSASANGGALEGPVKQDIVDIAHALSFRAEELLDNVNSVLNLHLTLHSLKLNEASHKTNEVVRLLTVFSVFFMPLNLLTGIYGMNFESMPFLRHPQGFLIAVAAMVSAGIAVVAWFRFKGWLR